ncbi:MAG: hypothetical protein C0594_07935 [Marinilabiliales bacterium]|nr:MAG: hypothetical protein C0594_07935 [Marinilabiliales bacterium]
MKNKLFLLILFIASSHIIFAQQVVFEEEVNDYYSESNKGPNNSRFSHIYLAYKPLADNSSPDTAFVMPGKSGIFEIGIRNKYKIAKIYALGYNINFRNTKFKYGQFAEKTFPSNTMFDKEQLILRSLSLEIYNRFQPARTGNRIGWFIDLGIEGGWIFNNTYKTILKSKTDIGNITEKTAISGLSQFKDFTYTAKARIGFGQFALSAEYRLSDLVNKDHNYVEPPRLFIGIEAGLFLNNP